MANPSSVRGWRVTARCAFGNHAGMRSASTSTTSISRRSAGTSLSPIASRLTTGPSRGYASQAAKEQGASPSRLGCGLSRHIEAVKQPPDQKESRAEDGEDIQGDVVVVGNNNRHGAWHCDSELYEKKPHA